MVASWLPTGTAGLAEGRSGAVSCNPAQAARHCPVVRDLRPTWRQTLPPRLTAVSQSFSPLLTACHIYSFPFLQLVTDIPSPSCSLSLTFPPLVRHHFPFLQLITDIPSPSCSLSQTFPPLLAACHRHSLPFLQLVIDIPSPC